MTLRRSPHALRAPIEAELRNASGGLPVAYVRTMGDVEARSIARQRFNYSPGGYLRLE